ncbi:MAG: HEAT repeat domain-containing protein [Planctomycetaceae bacterium]
MAPLASPFSSKPLSNWIQDLQQAATPEDRYRAVLAVSALGDCSARLQWFQHALKDVDSGVRALAAKLIGEAPNHEKKPQVTFDWSPVEADLALGLKDPDPDVRFEVARALGRINPQLASPRELLISLLHDEETQPLMLAVVVSALAERKDHDIPVLIPRLKQLLGHPQAEVRENTAAFVAGSQSLAAGLTLELIAALDDDEPLVRENAARALGTAGVRSPEVLAGLQMASADEDEIVAQVAQDAHQRLAAGG